MLSWAGETTSVVIVNLGLAVFVLAYGFQGAYRDRAGLWKEWTTGPRIQRFGSMAIYLGMMVLAWIGLRLLAGVFL